MATQTRRPVLFEAHAVVHDNFPAPGNPEKIVGSQGYPKHPRVEGVAGVNMGNAPVHPARKALANVRRILPASDHRSRGRLRRFLRRSRSVSDAGEFAVVRIRQGGRAPVESGPYRISAYHRDDDDHEHRQLFLEVCGDDFHNSSLTCACRAVSIVIIKHTFSDGMFANRDNV